MSPVRIKPPIAAVVFDLDGTLLDHVAAVRAGVASWLSSLGVPTDPALIDAWFEVEERYFALWQTGEISFAEQRRRRLRAFLPMLGRGPGDDAALDCEFEGFRSAYQRAWTDFEDVAPTLTRLARQHPQVNLAVLTNGAEDQQRAKLTALGLDVLLPRLFTAETLGVAKPAAAAFLAVCQTLGPNPTGSCTSAIVMISTSSPPGRPASRPFTSIEVVSARATSLFESRR